MDDNAKYKRYFHSVEKILQSFDSVNEWADVIKFLSLLGKVRTLQKNQEYRTVL